MTTTITDFDQSRIDWAVAQLKAAIKASEPTIYNATGFVVSSYGCQTISVSVVADSFYDAILAAMRKAQTIRSRGEVGN